MPCIALDGDGRTSHVVWNRRQSGQPDSLCYRKCTQDKNGNDKWGTVVHLYAGEWIVVPVVACVPGEANHVLVCWRQALQSGSKVTRFREYVNGAWQAVVRLDSSYQGPQGDAAIAAAANGDVFVAYPGYDAGTSGAQIFVKTRHNGVWGEPVNVTENLSCLGRGNFTIEVNPTTNNPHVVFDVLTEVTTGGDPDTFAAVYHTFRNASGDWLTTPEPVSEPHRWPGTPQPDKFRCYPTMAFAGNGAAHVVWHDTVPATGHGIMYSYCSSEGGAWSTPELLTSADPEGGPFITVEEPAHSIRLVWALHLGDNPYCDQIWWKSNYLGGGGGQAQPVALPPSDLELFPNPAKAGRVTVRYALPHAGPMTVTLLDVSGRLVRQSAICNLESEMALDLKGLRPGVYIVKLDVGTTSQTRKLVIR